MNSDRNSNIRNIRSMCASARDASRRMAGATAKAKNDFLRQLGAILDKNRIAIMDANRLDLDQAIQSGLDGPRLDRLTLTNKIIDEMIAACSDVANMPDPVGVTESQWSRPNGLLAGKMRIPLGVIAMIYEARPNVTIDAAILCLKAGNAVILRGGREAINSNRYLARLLGEALEFAGLPNSAASLVENPDHAIVTELCRMDEFIDLVIPRGGEKLIRAVCETATVPVLKHYKGVCHAYIDKSADLNMALDIVENSKTQRPGVCNALEGLLVHRDVAGRFLPMLAVRLQNVEFHACQQSLPLLGPAAKPLTAEDPGTEYHSLILAVLVVKNMDEALAYIDKYSSHHTDIICTEDYRNAMRFLREVDSSMVAVNASTRFNDGGQLGLGAEIGISTSKLHAFGPMGVKELTTTKFVVLGNGQIRQ